MDDVDQFLQDEEETFEDELQDQMDAAFLEVPEDDATPAPAASDANSAAWTRRHAPALNSATDTLEFQQLEVDYCTGRPDASFASPSQRSLSQVPILRMYGVTGAGNSVCAFVHGFEPYFFCKCSDASCELSGDDLPAFQDALNKLVMARSSKGANQTGVVRVEHVQARNVWNYRPGPKETFYKVTMSLPNLVTPARTLLEEGLEIPSLGLRMAFDTFESNVLFVLRFMIDCAIVGGCWVGAPAGKYALGGEGGRPKLSTCQYDVHLSYRDVVAHEPTGPYSRMAPFRVLSVDIECCGRKGIFPEPEHDAVIQIATTVQEMGSSEPFLRHVATLGTCGAVAGAQVESFETERELLLRWQQLLAAVDADVLIGYNILNFDFPYLVTRAKTLGLPAFMMWGRVRGAALVMRDAQFSSKAYGTHAYKDITIEGRVQFDLLTAIQRDHKLSSYSLNSVSAHFLGEQKEDVHHSCIADLQAGNADTRRRLAVYCLKDALLPMRLFNKLLYMYNQVEMARVTGVPMSFLLTRGQSIKVFSQILRYSQREGYLVPFLKGGRQADGVAYEGATVLHAHTGYYAEPVATLDFASLYPSIMMAHNLCYSTLVRREDVGRAVPAADVARCEGTGEYFVKDSVRKGLLPQILRELLAARKRAKADLKAATDPFVKAVLDGRQLALKVSANSVYGFTGATVGKMCCLAISGSVTAYGRAMIEHTRTFVERHYTRANGYDADAHVVYGDTDSVMVNFKVGDLTKSMQLGEEAAELVSKEFPNPVKLEFEKVYYPYLLMSKKRYAGLLWTRPDQWDKMDTKGIETVRRDNCLLVRNMVTHVLDVLLKERDPDKAVEHVKGVIADLLLNKIDMSELVISKSLSQDAEAYKATAAHVELAKKMMKRDSATAPTVGDRVAFVIVKGAKGAKAHEKAEDPIYALENNLPIDAQHYLEHHLSQPLMRLFEPILGEKRAKSLLTGEHTRAIQVSTPSAGAGGIMKFAKKTLKCMGCKAALPPGSVTLCKHCEPREAELYAKSLQSVSELEGQYDSLWTQCQRCQGSLHQDVLCASRDCPIFYRRWKVHKDLNEAQGSLARFIDW